MTRHRNTPFEKCPGCGRVISHSRFGFVMHRRIEGDSRSPWCSRQAPTEIYLELPRGDR